jgi:Uncharacterised protein family UPF0047
VSLLLFASLLSCQYSQLTGQPVAIRAETLLLDGWTKIDSLFFLWLSLVRSNSVSHTKTSLVGTSISIPITGGRLNLGTWQGV